MSKNGIRQLKQMRIRYCDWGGSSVGTREFIRDKLKHIAAQHPYATIELEVCRNRHPVLFGEYMNGNTKQICVRNRPVDYVKGIAERLLNESGVRSYRVNRRRVLGKHRSIQLGNPQ